MTPPSQTQELLTKNELAQFMSFAAQYQNENRQQRRGQALFNALNRLYPALAETVRGTDDDPFYNDSRIEKFIQAITHPTPKPSESVEETFEDLKTQLIKCLWWYSVLPQIETSDKEITEKSFFKYQNDPLFNRLVKDLVNHARVYADKAILSATAQQQARIGELEKAIQKYFDAQSALGLARIMTDDPEDKEAIQASEKLPNVKECFQWVQRERKNLESLLQHQPQPKQEK